MFGGCAIDHSVPGDVADQDWFVIQVLAQSSIRRPIEEILEVGDLWPVIRKRYQDWLLDVVRQIATWLDLCKSVVECPGLRDIPQGVDEVVGISFDVEVVLLPHWSQARKLLDVHWLCKFQGLLDSFFCVGFLQQCTCPGECSPRGVGIAPCTWVPHCHGEVLENDFCGGSIGGFHLASVLGRWCHLTAGLSTSLNADNVWSWCTQQRPMRRGK